MARVLTLGITVFDTVLRVGDMPCGGGKFYASDRAEVVGGIAANAAIAIVRLGGEAVLASRVGDDLIGEAVLASRVGDDLIGERIVGDLVAAGVDTSMVEWLNGVASSISTILVDGSGERLLVNHSDPLLFRGLPDLESVAVDAVMTDTRWPEGSLAALRRGRELAVPAVLDYDRDTERLRSELLATATHVAFGQQGLEALAGTDDVASGLRTVSRMTEAWLACTSGGGGVHWLDGGTLRHLPAFPIKVVDTLGAGDVFHGAFALALAEGMPETAALRFASAAAAVKCTRFGGGAVSPTRAELAAFLGETV